MKTLNLESVLGTSADAAKARANAKDASRRACRVLERALVHALDTEPLRGLSNLGTAEHPFYAARVRGMPDVRLPLDPEKWSLVVNPHGLLVMARLDADGARTEPVLDEEFLAEDCESLANCLAIILPRHIARAEAAGIRFRRFEDFATKVEALFKVQS